MKKVVLQFLTIVLLFFGTWFLLSQIDWEKMLKIEKVSQTTEKKLGELFWDLFKKSETEILNKKIVSPVDTLLTHICHKNNINRDNIKLHLIDKDEINAFALPGDRIILFTGLIKTCENEAELCGVLGHELAHLQKSHVMKKLIKEVGLSVLISLTTGNSGADMAKEILKLLSSSAYDRSMEREADITAIDYLIKANINPEPFANFLYRFALQFDYLPDQFYWVSTHPEAEERSKEIIEYIQEQFIVKLPVLNKHSWNRLQQNIVSYNE